MHQQQPTFENMVEKGEIARTEQFLLFPPCFLLNQIIVSPYLHIFFSLYLHLLLNLKSLQLAHQVKDKSSVLCLFEHGTLCILIIPDFKH